MKTVVNVHNDSLSTTLSTQKFLYKMFLLNLRNALISKDLDILLRLPAVKFHTTKKSFQRKPGRQEQQVDLELLEPKQDIMFLVNF